jgi:hypothetical protein
MSIDDDDRTELSVTCRFLSGTICQHQSAAQFMLFVLQETCEACVLREEIKTSVCTHRGSRRRCCDQLHICRLLKTDVTEADCQACEHFESTGPS